MFDASDHITAWLAVIVHYKLADHDCPANLDPNIAVDSYQTQASSALRSHRVPEGHVSPELLTIAAALSHFAVEAPSLAFKLKKLVFQHLDHYGVAQIAGESFMSQH